MANMSYCRFENTYRDLRDCMEALEEGGELSASEQKWKKELVELCADIAREYGPGGAAHSDALLATPPPEKGKNP